MAWKPATINGHQVYVSIEENGIHILNAYNIKDDLKIRGYRWNPEKKTWYLITENPEEEYEILINNFKDTESSLELSKNSYLSKFPQSYTVVELRNKINKILKEGLKGRIWVRGVIASDINSYKWFSYFDLRDESDKNNLYFNVEVSNDVLNKINEKLIEKGISNGLEKDLPVFLMIEVNIPLRNVIDIRLKVIDILTEYTQSKIRNQLEITIERLKKEGLYDNQKRLKLPKIIENIGLITSDQGTSSKDIMAGLNPYEKVYNFYFIDTRMEGVNAVDSVISSINYLESRKELKLDAIIIARGGGSEQSLSVFNDYNICKRVCECKIPVLTSIGHEKDISAVEIISNITPTPSTPSGMGQYLKKLHTDMIKSLSETTIRLSSVIAGITENEEIKLKTYISNLPNIVNKNFRFNDTKLINKIKEIKNYLIQKVVQNSIKRESIKTKIKNILLKSNSSLNIEGKRISEKVSKSEAIVKRIMDNLNKNIIIDVENIKKETKRMLLKSKESLFDKTNLILWKVNYNMNLYSKELIKNILKLDFRRLDIINKNNEENIRKSLKNLYDYSQRVILNNEKEINSFVYIVNSNNPENILKKGFTMALDKNNKVIKNKKDFLKHKNPKLKFYDGNVIIIKKEEEK